MVYLFLSEKYTFYFIVFFLLFRFTFGLKTFSISEHYLAVVFLSALYEVQFLFLVQQISSQVPDLF
jgi:hypothetical protein